MTHTPSNSTVSDAGLVSYSSHAARPSRRRCIATDEAAGLQPTSTSPVAHGCSWPIGTPGAAGFGFCGRQARGSYCETHRQIGTVAISAKDNDKFMKSALWAADRDSWGGRRSAGVA